MAQHKKISILLVAARITFAGLLLLVSCRLDGANGLPLMPSAESSQESQHPSETPSSSPDQQQQSSPQSPPPDESQQQQQQPDTRLLGNYGPYSSGQQQQNQGTGYSSSSYQQSGGSSSSYPASYNHQQGNLYEASPPSYAATGYESRPAYPYSPLNYGSAPVYQHVGYTRPLASAYNNNPTMMGPSSYSGNSRGYGAASPYNPYPTSTNYQQHNDGYDNSFLYQHYIEPYMYGQMTYY